MTGRSFPMEMLVEGKTPGGKSVTIVVFAEQQDMPDVDAFLYNIGFSTGEVKALEVNSARQIPELVDLN